MPNLFRFWPLLLLIIVLVTLGLSLKRENFIPQFYADSEDLSSFAPGTLLKKEALSDSPSNANGWRILYTSLDFQTNKPITKVLV